MRRSGCKGKEGSLLISRNARPEKALVERAQREINQTTLP